MNRPMIRRAPYLNIVDVSDFRPMQARAQGAGDWAALLGGLAWLVLGAFAGFVGVLAFHGLIR